MTAVLGLAAALAPSPAEACGGFFCSQVPVDQSGELIVFTVRDGKVEAHVSIQYVGEAEDFAWIVPVHGVPTLGVGAPAFFQYLAQATQPQFQLTWDANPMCQDEATPPPRFEAANGADAGMTTDVEVLLRSEVGPFDSAILAATDAAALKAWLVDNGYDIGTNADSAIDPYVGQGYNFVALKLQKDRAVGEIRPIVITFDGSRPCVPIRLTAVAARPDMPIIAWVFAEARSVPINYRHVLVNETRIDWLNFGANYLQVASRAVDEAGGRAFLTEFAGSTSPLANPPAWILPGPSLDTAKLATMTHPVDFVTEVMNQGFPRGDPALFAMFQRYVPLPKSLEGQVSAAAFYNVIWMYRAEIDSDPGRAPFDAVAFANQLESAIVAPLRRAHEILDGFPYVTRLFTTMSADEMTVDPEFEFNSSAVDVSNLHRARAQMVCSSNRNEAQITLENGWTFRVSLDRGTVADGPFALRVEQYTESGPPALIRDNTPEIQAVIGRPEYRIANGCGCGSAGPAAPLAALLVLGLRSLAGRRRKIGR